MKANADGGRPLVVQDKVSRGTTDARGRHVAKRNRVRIRPDRQTIEPCDLHTDEFGARVVMLR
jgi:hypothetical protein